MSVRCILLILYLFSTLAMAGESSSRIAMVLWRGKTEAEEGFLEYLKVKQFKGEIVLLDCARNKETLLQYREQLRKSRPDLIYTFGTTVTKVLAGSVGHRDPSTHITDIPIVFGLVSTPIRSKVVSRWESSGCNITGVSHLAPMGTQFATLQSLYSPKHMGVLYNPAEDNSVAQVTALQELCKKNHCRLTVSPLLETIATDKVRIKNALLKLAEAKVDLVYLPSDSFLMSHSAVVTEQALALQIPTYGVTEKYLRQGKALAGLVSNYNSVGQFCAYKALAILRQRKKPSAVPIETLKRFSLLLNMNVARQLKVFPPVDALMFAEVINGGAGGDH